jgi:hypothetical protein
VALPGGEHEPLDLEPRDRCEVFGVAGEHSQLMLEGGCGDEGIARLQTVAEREGGHELGGALRDGRCDRQDVGLALREHLLDGGHLGLVTHPLQKLQIAHGGERELWLTKSRVSHIQQASCAR